MECTLVQPYNPIADLYRELALPLPIFALSCPRTSHSIRVLFHCTLTLLGEPAIGLRVDVSAFFSSSLIWTCTQSVLRDITAPEWDLLT